jgi:hypothetical protein
MFLMRLVMKETVDVWTPCDGESQLLLAVVRQPAFMLLTCLLPSSSSSPSSYHYHPHYAVPENHQSAYY